MHTLALPSLSTGIEQFDPVRAASVAMREVATFLRSAPQPSLRLYLVEPSSSIREAFEQARAADPEVAADRRFALVDTASLTTMRTAGLEARFIANPANHKLAARGIGINRAVHSAAPELETATRACFPPSARPGVAYPVRVPSGCPLRDEQGCEWVIHVHGPNFNRDRALCLDAGDYTTGCQLLAETYAALFDAFRDRLDST